MIDLCVCVSHFKGLSLGCKIQYISSISYVRNVGKTTEGQRLLHRILFSGKRRIPSDHFRIKKLNFDPGETPVFLSRP